MPDNIRELTLREIRIACIAHYGAHTTMPTWLVNKVAKSQSQRIIDELAAKRAASKALRFAPEQAEMF